MVSFFCFLHAYEPELTTLQAHVLDLLGVPESRYRPND